MAQTAQPNRKKIMYPTTMSRAGKALIDARDDVEGVEFVPNLPVAQFHKMLEEASGICLGIQRFSDPELDAGPLMEVVSRIGVGYDAVDVPALTSARRWERDGWLRRTLENSLLLVLFLAGYPPERLRRRYDVGRGR